MTYYENQPKKQKFGTGRRHKQMVCPECLAEYTLGINGTMSGCDKCQQITRNAGGMIIYGTSPFIKEEEQS